MPLMACLTQRFAVQRPFEGLAIAACLHVTAETAMMVRLLRAGGAAVSLAASNPLSTQDDIAAALAVRYGTAVFARAGVDRRGYYRHIERALAERADGPDLVIDDGGDLVNTLHTRAAALLPAVKGGCESTATGVIRLRRMAAEGALAFPVIAADDTAAKRLVEGACGTGQSVIDGILRATNTLLAGKTVVVAGFGASGRGVAERARGLGAQVIVTEVDPIRALDASLRGFRVLPMAQAAPLGEVFVTATGSCDVIGAEHIAAMRDGAILANAGHFDVEIDVRALAEPRRRGAPGRAAARGRLRPRRRPDRPAARRGPGGEPRRGRGPSPRGDGPGVRHRGAGAGLAGRRRVAGGRGPSSRSACTRCPPTSTPKPPGSSWPRQARRSTRCPPPSRPTWTAWRIGS